MTVENFGSCKLIFLIEGTGFGASDNIWTRRIGAMSSFWA